MSVILNGQKIGLVSPDREHPILYETDISVNQGDFIVVLGPNGSGKSSLIKILYGSRLASFGKIYLNCKELTKLGASQRAKDLVILSQKVDDKLFVEMTLEENSILWEERFDKDSRLNYEQVCALTPNPGKFIKLKKQLVGSLSGGEKQAFLLALVLAHPPKILFLDEHTSALDYKTAKEVMKLSNLMIQKHKITTIMVTHELEDAMNYGNKLIILNEGKVIFNGVKTQDLDLESIKEMIYC